MISFRKQEITMSDKISTSGENMFISSDLLSGREVDHAGILTRAGEYILSSSGWRAVFALAGD